MSGLNPDEIRSRIDLAALIGSRVPLKRQNGWSMACCPFHGEKNPSFGVRHSTQRYHCFGCGAHGDCFDWVQRTEGVDFPTALAQLAALAGVEAARRYKTATSPLPAPSRPENQGSGGNEFAARKIWKECVPIAGTRGEAYFRARGITVPLPSTLRFHRGLRHAPSKQVLPAVVGAVCTLKREIVGVWRIYLDPKEAVKATVTPNKMGLGRAAGCAVRLSKMSDTR